MTAATACRTCGTEPLDNAWFCHGCGSPLIESSTHAEYKQVTVLFADVVHSMDIAAAVGAERLREIMAELVDRSTAVVQRYGGTVDKFTGDGIMAVFGAPIALEDHAFRACLAALDIQQRSRAAGRRSRASRRHRPAAAGRPEFRSGDRRRNRFRRCELHRHRRAGRDGSADGIGGAAGRGDAQRVDGPTGRRRRGARRARTGADQGRRRTGARAAAAGQSASISRGRRGESTLVGRTWELNTVAAILDEAIGGARLRRQCHGAAGNRQEPAGPRSRRRRRQPGSAGVRHLLRIACQRHPVPRGGAVVAREHWRSTISTRDAARARVREQIPRRRPRRPAAAR